MDGVVRVLRDVVLDRTSQDELLAVSHAPGVSGETMTLDLIGGGIALAIKVTVLESRPVIVNGAVRHRLRLALHRRRRSSRTHGRVWTPFGAQPISSRCWAGR